MGRTLAKDPRYVPRPEPYVSRPEVYDRYNGLAGRQKRCANRIAEDHRAAVGEACELHQCGDHVAGGCAHITGYAGHVRVLEVALEKCVK